MENKIKVGDVVCLKKDNTKVTVEALSDNIIKCIWFDKNHQLHEDVCDKTELIIK